MARAAARDNPAEEGRREGPTEAEHRFSDELGFFWEDAGGTRMAGRVLGALLLADPPEMSSSELTEFLGVSAGSVSTATRELIRPGLAQRVRMPGKRQDYFRATMGASVLPQIIRTRIELTRRYGQLMQRGEGLAAHKDPAVRRQLEEIREFYEFIEAEQLAILERWEQRRKERASR
jgi:DNA-binding MarR family transcriptional regulator